MAENDLAERVRQYGSFLDDEIRFAQRHLENLGRTRGIPTQTFDDVKREIKVYQLAQRRLYEIIPEAVHTQLSELEAKKE